MLADGQLKPHLLHPDSWVRGAAACYFGYSWSTDPDLAALILEGCGRYGMEKSGSSFCHLFQLRLSDRDFDQVLELMERADSRHDLFPLSRCLGTVALPLLRDRVDRISRIRRLSKRARLLVEERLEDAACPVEVLWDRARDTSLRPEETPTFDGFNQARRDAMVGVLASQGVPDDATVLRLLRSREIAGSWLEANLVSLAGARRLREAVPMVVDRLSAEDMDLPGEAMVALQKIGDPEAVRLVRSRFRSEAQAFRLDAAHLLGSIKSPESEAAILSLLEDEDEPEVRQALLIGLCELFSREGIDLVRTAIREVPEPDSLKLTLLPVLDVLGVEVPEAKEWKSERDEDRPGEGIEEARAVAERLHEIMEQGEEAVEETAFLKEQARSFGWLPPEESERRDPSDTIVRDQPKVGRNDPCPCGSGKKHKFCCGRG